MKKNVLKDIDKIKEERKISKDVENKIFIRAITNCGIGISIILLVMIFYVLAKYLSKNIATSIYNSVAFVMLITTLVIIETAYKKDSGKWAITSVEMLVISIYSLFAPFIFIRVNYKYIYGFIALATLYYTFKIVKIYFSEKQKYWEETSDIATIIQKESKDELAEKEKIKQKEEIKKLLEMQEKEAKTTRKSTARKTTSKKTNTTKTIAKKTGATKKPATKKAGTTTRKVGTTTKKTTTKKTGTTKKKTTTKKAPAIQKENEKQGE